MPPNETSALLKNYREHQTTNSCRNGYVDVDNDRDMDNHIVYVSKDPAEYEPIFSLNDYSSALTLDELLPYKLDPWWQNLRRILFLTFWLTLIMTFLTACLLAYLQAGHTSCNSIIDKQLSASTALGILSSTTTSTTTTTLPTTIAEIISTELLSSGGSSKLPLLTVVP